MGKVAKGPRTAVRRDIDINYMRGAHRLIFDNSFFSVQVNWKEVTAIFWQLDFENKCLFHLFFKYICLQKSFYKSSYP